MKLVELKCKNCGSLLKVEDGVKEVTCTYCHTSFILDDEVQHIQHDNMYESGYEFEKGRIKAQDEKQESNMNEDNVKSFNANFEDYSGTQSNLFISELLDNINTNNKTNSNKKIDVAYEKAITSEEKEIIKIKHSLGNNLKKYEVILDYDEEGYVNKVTIEKIKKHFSFFEFFFIFILFVSLGIILISFFMFFINASWLIKM